MLEVNEVSFEDLTDDEKEDQPDNGSGKEWAGYLKVTHGGRTLAIYSDAMEPEDCRFSRCLEWVSTAISEAYERGKQDA
tara:strand:- start:2330 stop:2566 length:237 start_codon:yes stop_codon:yes gene_type:complete